MDWVRIGLILGRYNIVPYLLQIWILYLKSAHQIKSESPQLQFIHEQRSETKVIRKNTYWPHDVILRSHMIFTGPVPAKLHWDYHWYPYMSCLWMIWGDLEHFRCTRFFSHCLIMGGSQKWTDLRSLVSKICKYKL